MSIGPYLYRGTTAGWPGNSVLQEEEITCTSTDPLVATLFAIECRNHGHAVILAVRRDRFRGIDRPPNYFCRDRVRGKLANCSQRNSRRRAEVVLEVDRSLAILTEMGFQNIPVRFRDKEALQQELIAFLRDLGSG